MATFHAHILSLDTVYVDTLVLSITVPTAAGVLTLLAQHEPLIASIASGTIVVTFEDTSIHTFAVESGVVEMGHSGAKILVY
jgi:F-type H+-transporting ATPase subunit epsilon